LKEKSIATHKTWVNQGRPRQGNVLFEKQKAKTNYKKMINIKRSNAKGKISDSLNNALFDKNQHEF